MAASSKNVVGAGTLVLDKVTINSDGATDGFVVNTDKFTVAASSGNTVIGGTASIAGTLTAAAINSTGTHAITGALTVSTTSTHTGNSTFGGTVAITGTLASGALTVTGAIAGSTTLAIATDKFNVSAAGVVAIASTTGIVGNMWVGHATEGSAKFNVVAASGNTTAAGTLDAGATGFHVDATGNVTKMLSVAAGTNNTEFTVSAAGALICATTLSAGGAAFTVNATGDLTKVLSIAGGTSQNKFTVSSAGAVAIASTLAVTGALTQTGAAGFTGDITLAGSGATCCHIYGNADVVAKTNFATSGTTKAVTFGKAYAATPAVFVTPITDNDVGYNVSACSTAGFTITRPSGGSSSAEFYYFVKGIPA